MLLVNIKYVNVFIFDNAAKWTYLYIDVLGGPPGIELYEKVSNESRTNKI